MTKRLHKTDRHVFLRDLSKAVTRCSREEEAVGLLVVQVEQLDKVEGAFGYCSQGKTKNTVQCPSGHGPGWRRLGLGPVAIAAQ